ncbi:MAG TPA: tRNA (adenosine(37)-N6)-threonylcarbamoyltransferase complex dimerization subunit type 1 TsaB [Flavobacteriaceae bacterium]|jgi:tRNA threonylcarbamoyladenosine biosynthesis protein TsaB|nr:tRNA (adenosine(37)-N6)-threonylcarbamoyltransferase complex dimerization subunit type 1 TsaB [Flavobacteriaceae bacterium]MCH2479582.1 tRNA (adenosine(37)-N6)-threonylcarbamoyltransferase complex dimerization subunit type 1 TsaB [Flavobacteriales bacterium]MDP7183958.1 tRNA (adenosine(37)-N6)-threonylcarbamoyltransferase complex dimerization subunit type 1 TsaB [Flavobacteriaceae bacterium]HJO71177.1 tRNA (adenosine(37)-N6)-threonylcarbamoyltransferase complex dimerization subunit type 1 Tsa|tara:strand:+ start:718 stop:1374 length:657 start_codon:yes stop_codon:yes gene_type:complete
MSYILNLETSSKNCSVSLLKEDKIINLIEQEDDSYRHSELLTSFIDQILSKEKIKPENLSAVAIAKGPGSFTGLRIGFSVAKGICFPYKTPIIGINSLEILARSYKPKKDEYILSLINDKNDSFYSMVLDSDYNEVEKPSVEVIDKNYISRYGKLNSLVIVCNTKSIKEIINEKSVKIEVNSISAKHMENMSKQNFDKKNFEDLAYFEPMYIKKPYVD